MELDVVQFRELIAGAIRELVVRHWSSAVERRLKSRPDEFFYELPIQQPRFFVMFELEARATFPIISTCLGWSRGRGVPQTGLPAMVQYRAEKQLPKGAEGIGLTGLVNYYETGTFYPAEFGLPYEDIAFRKVQQKDLPEVDARSIVQMLNLCGLANIEDFGSPHVDRSTVGRGLALLDNVLQQYQLFTLDWISKQR